VGRGLNLGSGQVIALGRVLLGALILTVASEGTQRAQLPTAAYVLMIAYLLFAAGMAVATWNDWWADAQIAGPAHAIDIAVFVALVYLTAAEPNPFYGFFIFILLAAAIRWGWRATGLTAVLLSVLYVLAGLFALGPAYSMALDRFVVRTGYLAILSLILMWFGVNQWRAGLLGASGIPMPEPAADTPPLEGGLMAAMAATGAKSGALVWAKAGKSKGMAITVRDGEVAVADVRAPRADEQGPAPFLYDLARGHGMSRDAKRNLHPFDPRDRLREKLAIALKLREGLAIPLPVQAASATLYLEELRGLSTDHLDLAQEIATAVAGYIHRQAAMRAAEEKAEARSRLAVARDLHDSVVQFLAGAAFRLEALKRSDAVGRDLTPELNELKQLMLQEQGELRSFITALRSGSQVELADLARDLQSLSNRLARQWDIQCTFSLEENAMSVPMRMHMDAQQLVREAVANAVRHAGAKNVSIRLSGDVERLKLDFINDGTAYPRSEAGNRMPRSLSERVSAAGGQLELSRGMGVTKISVALPMAGTAA
jgi:signal transduction histidine kinase